MQPFFISSHLFLLDCSHLLLVICSDDAGNGVMTGCSKKVILYIWGMASQTAWYCFTLSALKSKLLYSILALKLARDWKRFSTLSPLFHWNIFSFAAIMFLRKQPFWEDSFQNPCWSLSPDNQLLVQYCLLWTFCIESCWGGYLTVECVRTVYWSNEPSLKVQDVGSASKNQSSISESLFFLYGLRELEM